MYSKDIKRKIDENTNFNPKSAYGIAKVASHYLIKNYRDNLNFNASTGILFNHESLRKDEKFVLRKYLSQWQELNSVFKKLHLGNIKSKRDWGHAKDYVDAMWLINQQKVSSDYIIGSGQLNSVETFVKKAFAHVKLDYKKYLKIDKKLLRKKDSKARIANPTKMQKKLDGKENLILIL